MTDRAKYILESIDGLNWLAIVPLIIFFIIFIGLIYVTYAKKRQSLNDYMAQLPLEDSDQSVDN